MQLNLEDCHPQRQQLRKMLKNTLLRNRWPLYSITIHHQVTVDGFIQCFADRRSFHVLNRFWSISIPYFDVDRDRILDPIFWRGSGSYDLDPSTEKAKYFWIFWNVANCLKIFYFLFFRWRGNTPWGQNEDAECWQGDHNVFWTKFLWQNQTRFYRCQ